MRAFAAIFIALVSTAALPQALAQGFAGDDRVFSGIAGSNGDGLITDSMIVTPSFLSQGTRLALPGGEASEGLALFNLRRPDPSTDGLGVFPSAAGGSGATTLLLADGALWGVTPYVGAGLAVRPLDNGLFQGMDRLLPPADPATQLEGVAGLSYQFLPGIGAGIEYRFRDGGRSTTLPGSLQGESQTIMLRLDLGLN